MKKLSQAAEESEYERESNIREIVKRMNTLKKKTGKIPGSDT